MSVRRSVYRRWNAVVNAHSLYAFISIFVSAAIGITMGGSLIFVGEEPSYIVTVLLGAYSVSFLILNVPPLLAMYFASVIGGWRSSFTRKQRWESALKAIHRLSWYIAAMVACLSLLFLGWS